MDLWLGIQTNYEKRKETLLEAPCSKITKEVVDEWFNNYKAFLSKRNLLDKPHKIYNTDETGWFHNGE